MLSEVTNLACQELDCIRGMAVFERDSLEEHLRRYCSIRLMLEEHEISDNITEMVRFYVSRITNIDIAELKKQDMPGMCGSAPAVLAERIHLFLAIQKGLSVKILPDLTPDIQTIQDLTDILIPLLK